ncbi:MAG TPA: hypothetical protein VFQ53_27795 [Kofleriaceae bacterium]|nr:hypothetical protein [Kofleriaceae bacterium]
MKIGKRLAILALASLIACGDDAVDPGVDGGNNNATFDQCDGDAPSFVRQSMLALIGRRPKSQAEVDVYVDLYNSAKQRGDDPVDVVARAIMSRPEFSERWIEAFMDALHVQRLDIQNEETCWDHGLRPTANVTGALATAVRDKPATQTADGGNWTMVDLARSALALDDVSPIYRAQLFSLVDHPIPAANVGAIEAELARRADFGATFDATYLHRDTVCLGCHNSESSVTDSDDPVADRHWPVPGNPERAVFGSPTGVAVERAHAAFRVDSFVEDGSTRPWSWSGACGQFRAPSTVPSDIAGIDAKLASVTGQRATVFDLEQSLARGFAALRAGGVPAPGAALADPDAALAWLVTLKITEDVYQQVTGTRLTIANYFPRNQASSDLLYALASKFAGSGFSLKTLLVAIVASDYFNRQPAELGCGPSPYTYPNVFDPWVIADADPARQHNGPGDAVTPVDARTLLQMTSTALEWSAPPLASRFPGYGEVGCETLSCTGLSQACNFGQCCVTHEAACKQNGVFPQIEVPFQRGIGVFLRNSERGFRGLDFQARLAWENRTGACGKPRWVTQDFIDRLAAAGAADPEATVADAIAALKDRLVGEPAIAEGAETDALVAIAGPLDAPASAIDAARLRQICGALVQSPQYLLQGIAGRGGDRPRLTPDSAGYDAVCADLAATGIGVPGRVVACGSGTATLADGRTAPASVTAPAPPAMPDPVRQIVRPRGLVDPRRTPAPTHR